VYVFSLSVGPCLVCTPIQDVNKDPGAEDTFKRIGEAYEVSPSAASR